MHHRVLQHRIFVEATFVDNHLVLEEGFSRLPDSTSAAISSADISRLSP